MIGKLADKIVGRQAKYFATEEAMQKHGIDALARWGYMYNRSRFNARWNRHREAYATEAEALLDENAGGKFKPTGIKMVDGWALDTSRTLPHLEELLDQAAEVIKEKGGRDYADVQYPFLRSLLFPGALEKYPAFMNFVLSSEVLAVGMEYMKTIPIFSKTRPPAVRFMESNIKNDPDSHLPPRDSQLYHIDFYDCPMFYVLVLLEDVTMDCGPWTFLPASVSERITKEIGYRQKGRGYRLQDADVRPHIREGEEIVFAYPKGSVLFIDSATCMHFGSRNAISPRYMMMYGLTTPCRRDFSMTYLKPFKYPIGRNDSRLRRMVLE
jgi:hypothetical protein